LRIPITLFMRKDPKKGDQESSYEMSHFGDTLDTGRPFGSQALWSTHL
jgi:hypothetical protein